VQFAINPANGHMVVIEMNPRVSRSSALASKATGFPIAKVAAKLAVGYTLDELTNDITGNTPAAFEPTIDYVVTKIPRFAFEKFAGADPTLTTAMKSVGEAMAIGRTFTESMQKALRSLETGLTGFDEQLIPVEVVRSGGDSWADGRVLPASRLAGRFLDWAAGAAPDADGRDHAWFSKTVDLLRPRIRVLPNFSDWARAFFSDEFPIDPAAKDKFWKDPKVPDLLAKLADALAALTEWNHDACDHASRAVAESAGVKAGMLINATRVAIVGQAVAPPLFDTMVVLGQHRVVARLRKALDAK